MSTQTAVRRPVGALGRMGVVAGLHVAALYLIATSLGIVPPLISQPATAQLIQETEPPIDLPPQPTVAHLQEPTVTVPEPVVPVDAIDNTQDQIIVERRDDPPVIEIVPPTAGPVIVGVRQDPRRPLTKPAYPASDVRQGNEGKVELEIYVTPDGRIADRSEERRVGKECRSRWSTDQ